MNLLRVKDIKSEFAFTWIIAKFFNSFSENFLFSFGSKN